MAVEGTQALADAGSAGPVQDLGRSISQGSVDIANAQRRSDSRQPSAEDKALDVAGAQAVQSPVEELQDDAGVLLHRAADVRQEDDRPALGFAPAPRQVERRPTVLDGISKNSPEVKPGATRVRLPAARPPQARPPAHAEYEASQLIQLGCRHLREVLVLKHFLGTEGLRTIPNFDLDIGPAGTGTKVAESAKTWWSGQVEARCGRCLLALARVGLRAPAPPELIKEQLEQLELFFAVDQKGARRVKHLIAAADIHQLESPREIK